MANVVISGKAGCPFYARAELIAEELKNRLPHFSVQKMVFSDEEWETFVRNKLNENNWIHDNTSPLIWRDLVRRGGKGLLIGGCNEFLELAQEYYGLTCNKTSLHLLDIASENEIQRKNELAEKEEISKSIIPFKVTITNASTMVAYALILDLLNHSPFHGPLSLTLLDEAEKLEVLDGLVMEIMDCAFENVLDVKAETKIDTAFIKSDLVIILGAGDSTQTNNNDINIDELTLLKSQANYIQLHAKSDVIIIIANNSPGLSCSVMYQTASRISPQNLYGVVRQHENTAKSCIASKLKIKISDVRDIIIWGNPCYTNCENYDFTKVRVVGCDSAIWGPHIKEFSLPINEAIRDDKWLQKDLEDLIKDRYQSYHKNCNALRIASGISSQVRDILNGQIDETQYFSVIVCVEPYVNQYKGIFVSVPVIIKPGRKIEMMELTPEYEEKLRKICDNAQDSLEKTLNQINNQS